MLSNTRLLYIILAVTLMAFMVSGCEKAAEDPPDRRMRHRSFRDIPGVTEEEIKAIEALQKQAGAFIYGVTPSTEAFIKNDGAMSGYTVRLCDWLTALFGIRFQPRLYEWRALMTGLDTREIHFANFTDTKERRKTYAISSPIAERSIKIIRLQGTQAPDSAPLSRPARYVFLEGSAAFQAAAAALAPGTYEAVFAGDYGSIYQMLRMGSANGGADAFIGINIAEGGFAPYPDVVSEDFQPLTFIPISLATKNPALEPIISVVTKALKNGGAAYLAGQYKAGYEDYSRHKFFMRLNDEEKTYLRNHAVVPFASQYSSYPLSFFDAREKSWEGIVFEILGELTKLTGLDFELVNDQRASIPEIVKILASGRAYLIPQLIRTPDREDMFLWSPGPYMPDRYALLSRWSYPNISINDIPHEKIGLSKNTAFTEIFRSWFPNAANTKEYAVENDAFHALNRGEVDLVMAGQHRLITMTNYYEFSDYKVNFLFNHAYKPFFAFNKDQAILCSIIGKALAVIDADIIVHQWMSKTHNYQTKLVLAQRPWLIGAIILLVFVFSLLSILFYYKRHEGIRLKKLTNELQAAELKARHASEAKSRFLARMSHEIRTPMNAILGITELQLHNATLTPNMKEAFDMIDTSGDMLLGIINDILDMSKIEAGKLELTPTEYDVASLIHDSVELHTVRIGNKPIKFELHVDANTPTVVVGDNLRVKQILNNLLSNAFKYTAKGVVTLSVSCETGQEEADATLVFLVSDTGQGMTAEQVSRLFDDYARFNLEANRTVEGAGLGMGITRNLVQLMHGELFVESEPGRGSTFIVRLPQKNTGSGVLGQALVDRLRESRIHSAAQMKRTQITREPMPYGSVLVVDDVATNLYVAKGLLASYNLAIDTVESGFAAIEKIKQGKAYDIVFMDHMMPAMDGIETTKHIRALGYTRPVVALTADAMIGRAEMFQKQGFDDFIAKPIDLRQMNAVLNRYVRDIQTPEVIEAARRQKCGADARGAGATLQASPDANLMKNFIRDASRSLALLETLCEKQDAYSDEDIRAYVINIHGMKCALANIGEMDLASLASKLEQAGRDRDSGVMVSETPAFLGVLRAVIEKITPQQDDEGGEATDKDLAYLREKLRALQAACAAYNKKAAKDALSEIEQQAWPRPTRERLDAIAEHLLHSKFKAIMGVLDEMLK